MTRLPLVIAAFFALAPAAFAQAANDAAWEHVPSGADFARAYPVRARTQHVGGQVLLNCLILRTQRLRCRVASEDPRGMGFGAAALQLAREFRVAARSHDGRPTAGGHIGVPLNFTVQRRPSTP
ncbi:MAG: energy transducer TonB [Vitreimonas sp.]